MAKTKVRCTKDLSGVYNALETGKNYLLSFDGKDAYLEEIPSDTGDVSVFVDGTLTSVTPAAGDVVVVTSAGVSTTTVLADGTYSTLAGDEFVIENGLWKAFTPAT